MPELKKSSSKITSWFNISQDKSWLESEIEGAYLRDVAGFRYAIVESSKSNDLQITDLAITNERISFYTNSPGELHLIKVSYFPNWTITNGKGPYRTSPSFMSIIPNDEYVEINFENTPIEKNIFYFSLFSLVLSFIIFIRSKQNDKET